MRERRRAVEGQGVGEKGRLQSRALQKEGRLLAALLSRSRGGCPSIGGWQRLAPLVPARWLEPSPLQPAEHRVGTEKTDGVCEGMREDRADAGLTRYPPYPNEATVRWPCLAEDPRCGRGRGAGWSSGPPLHFQPWQPDWGVRAWGAAKTVGWVGGC